MTRRGRAIVIQCGAKPQRQRTRTTIQAPYIPLAVEAEAWVAEQLALRGKVQ